MAGTRQSGTAYKMIVGTGISLRLLLVNLNRHESQTQ